MKPVYKLAGIFVISAAGVLFSKDASAQTCRVRAQRDVNFGNYDTLATGNLDTTGRIRVQCTQRDRVGGYTVKLDQGSGGGFTPRQMFNGREPLPYNLYLDSAHTTIWGDGTSGTFFLTVPGPPAPGDQSYTVYARTPLGQDVSVGLYTDTLTVTVEW